MSQFRKAIVALVGGAGTWLLTALSDGKITAAEWGLLGGVVATAAAVFQVRNARSKG